MSKRINERVSVYFYLKILKYYEIHEIEGFNYVETRHLNYFNS